LDQIKSQIKPIDTEQATRTSRLFSCLSSLKKNAGARLKSMLRRTLLLVAMTLSSSVLATPLTRYFPDQALGVIEAKDLQESVAQTGSFGEDTQQFLGTLLNEALSSELGKDLEIPGLLKDLTVRTMIGSIRDLAAAAYSVNGSPEFLAVVRMTPKNLIVNVFTDSFNEAIKRTAPKNKFREGNYLATLDNGIAAGIGNNLFYISSNKDLLRGYLKRLNGQVLPVIVNNPTYQAVNSGDGFFKHMIHYSAVAQLLQRDQTVPKRILAILKTLNISGSASSIVADGLETRTLAQLNPNGGDAALYKLLTYAPEKLELLQDLPSTAPSASVFATDTNGWLDYVDTWLPAMDLSTTEQQAVMDVFSKLRTRLGNEWGVVNGNLPNTNSLASGLGFGGISRSTLGLLGAGFLGDAFSPNSETIFYAKTQDGALILNDLETALQNAFNETNQDSEQIAPTVERKTIGGFEALVMTQTQGRGDTSRTLEIWVINKNNTIVIGSNPSKLESYLSAMPLLENPLFKTFNLPQRVTGVQFTAPVRLERSEIDAMIASTLKALQLEQDVPADLVTAFGDWFESWASRTEAGYGYFLPEGNKLRGFGKIGFSWNK
jgi:hypothetical protein